MQWYFFQPPSVTVTHGLTFGNLAHFNILLQPSFYMRLPQLVDNTARWSSFTALDL